MPHTPTTRSFSLSVLIAFVVLAIDTVLKIWALGQSEGVIHSIISGFLGLTLHKNYGIVANLPIPQIVILPLTVVILVVCICWLWKSRQNQPPIAASLLLLIAGGFGNLVDRLVHGFTTDYLIFFERSVINLSDVLIILGILGILLFHRPEISPSHS